MSSSQGNRLLARRLGVAGGPRGDSRPQYSVLCCTRQARDASRAGKSMQSRHGLAVGGQLRGDARCQLTCLSDGTDATCTNGDDCGWRGRTRDPSRCVLMATRSGPLQEELVPWSCRVSFSGNFGGSTRTSPGHSTSHLVWPPAGGEVCLFGKTSPFSKFLKRSNTAI